jgi:nucleotide-binding universal stress UspA family protein
MTMIIAVADARADAELVATARGLAAAAGWDVRAVHVREPGARPPGSAALDDIELTELEGEPATALGALVSREGVDAFAIGLRSLAGGASEPGLGHVAEAILAVAVVPLLLVRPGMRPLTGLKRLLVPLEGSPSGSASMRVADDAFCRRGREIVMLHVVTGDTPSESGSLPAPRMMDQEHYEWAAWQEEFTMRFSACPEGGRHRVSVRVGEPARVIAAEAEKLNAELVVLSWSGTFAAGHGAVVRELLDTAPCPLLLVPCGVCAA